MARFADDPGGAPAPRRVRKAPRPAAAEVHAPPEPGVQPAARAGSAAKADELVPRRGAGRPRWGAVVEAVFDLDPEQLYRELSAELTLGDKASTYGEVLAALDRAEQRALDAARLHRAAVLEQESVELEVAEEVEVYRRAARAQLEGEKAAGERSKAPTLQDVEDRVLRLYPDEVRAERAREASQKGAAAVLEQLVRSWNSRCASLRTMAERAGKGR